MEEQYNIMVVDDESIVCERLEKHFQKKGYSVETFTASQQALERLKEKTFDVVVTDLKMAGPNGIDLVVRMKDLNLPTRAIIITGYPDFETELASEYLDVVDYITKPFKLEELERQVVKAAKKARKTGGGFVEKIKRTLIQKKST